MLWMEERHAEMMGSGKRRKRRRSSIWRDREAKRVWKGVVVAGEVEEVVVYAGGGGTDNLSSR